MTSAQICIMIAIIVYLIGMIYIGFRCSKKNNSTDDFYLGGRKLGPFVTAMSAEASDMSSWLLMGLPGVAYLTGISDAGWTAIGLAVGTYINWLIVAKRIRRYTHTCNNSITIPSFFSNRYRDEKKMLQVIAAIFIVIFFIPYTASGFAACGKLFSSLFGVKYLTAMIISAIIHDTWRISCRFHNGLYPEYHHVGCSDCSSDLWCRNCWRYRCRYPQRLRASGISLHDTFL